MLFRSPSDKQKIVLRCFPGFYLCGQLLQFVNEFRYLGHILHNSLKDDYDVLREIRSMYARTNMLIRKFAKCSFYVKMRLFKSYCLCLYGAGLWSKCTASCLKKFKYCYHKCIKMFFGYDKYHSVTAILLDTGLPSFNTLLHNCRQILEVQFVSLHNECILYIHNVTIRKCFIVHV